MRLIDIEAEVCADCVCRDKCDRQAYCWAKAMQTVDAVPVVHGRWEYIQQTLTTLSQLRCSFCGWWSLDPSIDGAYNYCPNCGAKMDGGDNDAAD